ncbi:MAG: hypothetical protein HFF80_03355 [Oscillospiraceae bacterium]|nr:hypothetical protein [Oscillospiraceae bacterium]
MKNRVLSVLLTLCMVLALFPGTAFAAGNNRAAEGSIGTNGNEVYAVGSDVTLADLVSAVSASGTVAVDKSYTLAEDTTPVQINKAFTLSLGEKNINADLNVVEGGDLTVTGTGSLTGSLTMAAGTYRGTLPTGTKTITGGAFSIDVSAYIGADYECVKGADGLYVVSAKTTEPVKYTITVAEAANGTVSTDPANEAAEGDVVTVTANANEGYVLEKITVVDANSNNATVTDNKFTMPAANVTVTVTFAAIKPVEVTPAVKDETNEAGETIKVSTAEVTADAITKAEVTANTIAIKATSESAGDVSKVEVTLPTQAILDKKAEDGTTAAVATVEVSTDVGKVALPTEALSKAAGENVTMVVEKKDAPEAAKGEDGKEVEVAVSFQVDLVKASNKDEKVQVSGLSSEIKLTFDITGLWNKTVKPVLAYIDDARNITRLKGDYANGIITGFVNHLSEFGVVEDVAEPDEPTTPEEPGGPIKDAISIGAETEGGVGTVRKITIDTTKVSVDGNYLLVRVTADGKNIIYMVSAQATMDVSYKGSTDSVLAILLDGSDTNVMPDPGDDLVLAGCMAWAGK